MTVITVVVFANAINLIDGLDGLAAGIVIIAGTALFLYSTQLFDNGFLEGSNVAPLIAVIAVGVCVGFLPWNFNPARIFMGDAGSLSMGAALAVIALITGQILILPLIGVVFVIETLSVVLQVGYFKLTKGKRLFKMAPIHHHFELSGWAETQVTVRFWIIAIVAGFLGVAFALW